MAIKVLLLNFPKDEIYKVPSNVTITESTIENCPTLHDFHVIIIDADETLQEKWWPPKNPRRCFVSKKHTFFSISNFNKKIEEQIQTGGVTICLSCNKYEVPFFSLSSFIDNYFFCPIDLGIVNERGDTFYPKFEELKYFTPLFKEIPIKDIEWLCYFSQVPKNAKVLGTNRAGYAVFVEIPLGVGKLIMLPRFKNRAKAITTIVNEIVPQIIHEEEFSFVPQWLPDVSSDFEKQIRTTLRDIEKIKQLIYTKGKVLKNAVAFAFEKIGFTVDILPDGTLPDLRITDYEKRAIVEVKGHENTQVNRTDVLQLLGYLSETDIKEKGIVVANHEFDKKPNERNPNAFTDGAIQLAKNNDISLVSSIDLYEVIMKIYEEKLSDIATKKIRDKIMTGSGLIKIA